MVSLVGAALAGAGLPTVNTVLSIASRVVQLAKELKERDEAIDTITTKVEKIEKSIRDLEKNPSAQQRFEFYLEQAKMTLKKAEGLICQFADQHWLHKLFNAKDVKRRILELDEKLVELMMILLGLVSGEFCKIAQEEETKRKQAESASKLQEHLIAGRYADLTTTMLFSGGESVAQAQSTRAKQAVVPESILGDAWAGRFHVVSQKLYRQGLDEKARKTLANSCGRMYTLLHQAVFWDSLFGVITLLDNEAETDERTKADDEDLGIPEGSTALHIAVVTVNVEIVRVLLFRGADPKAQNKAGHSPKDLAAIGEHRQGIKELFESVDEIKYRGGELCAYSRAQAARGSGSAGSAAGGRGDWVNVRTLLNEGLVNPNMKTPSRMLYPLHQAAEQGNLDMCKCLIRFGALPTLRATGRKRGKLPSDMAADNHHSQVAEELRKVEQEAESELAARGR